MNSILLFVRPGTRGRRKNSSESFVRLKTTGEIFCPRLFFVKLSEKRTSYKPVSTVLRSIYIRFIVARRPRQNDINDNWMGQRYNDTWSLINLIALVRTCNYTGVSRVWRAFAWTWRNKSSGEKSENYVGY